MLEMLWDWLMIKLGFHQAYYVCFATIDRKCMQDYVDKMKVENSPILFGGIGGLATIVKGSVPAEEVGALKHMIAKKNDVDPEDVIMISINKL